MKSAGPPNGNPGRAWENQTPKNPRQHPKQYAIKYLRLVTGSLTQVSVKSVIDCQSVFFRGGAAISCPPLRLYNGLNISYNYRPILQQMKLASLTFLILKRVKGEGKSNRASGCIHCDSDSSGGRFRPQCLNRSMSGQFQMGSKRRKCRHPVASRML